jgi:hypothetical protein
VPHSTVESEEPLNGNELSGSGQTCATLVAARGPYDSSQYVTYGKHENKAARAHWLKQLALSSSCSIRTKMSRDSNCTAPTVEPGSLEFDYVKRHLVFFALVAYLTILSATRPYSTATCSKILDKSLMRKGFWWKQHTWFKGFTAVTIKNATF